MEKSILCHSLESRWPDWTLTDKASICKRYGVEYDPADWPAHGIQPEQFLADQGEIASKNARAISTGLRSTVSNVPGLRPDWKPLVECGFKMIHQLISPDLPAYDPPSNQQRRRGKKYHVDAKLNLEQFSSLIVKAIVTHNRTMQKNFDQSIRQVADGVRPIPRELWTYEARSRAGALARFDAEAVRMELLPKEAGIHLESLESVPRQLQSMLALVMAENGSVDAAAAGIATKHGPENGRRLVS